jgi:hypothetical protein
MLVVGYSLLVKGGLLGVASAGGKAATVRKNSMVYLRLVCLHNSTSYGCMIEFN